METTHLNYDFVPDGGVREVGDKLVISGTASNWDVDRVGDAVVRAAMERALTRYMENPILLFNHSYNLPAGRVTRAWIDDGGLHIEAELPRPDEPGEARHWWKLVKDGIVRALSIGGRWTRQAIGGVNYLTEIDLTEISVAAQGINASTTFTAQAAKAFGDPAPVASLDDLLPELRMLSLKAEIAVLEYATADLIRERM
jgi:HK97 family phage prohead protease